MRLIEVTATNTENLEDFIALQLNKFQGWKSEKFYVNKCSRFCIFGGDKMIICGKKTFINFDNVFKIMKVKNYDGNDTALRFWTSGGEIEAFLNFESAGKRDQALGAILDCYYRDEPFCNLEKFEVGEDV